MSSVFSAPIVLLFIINFVSSIVFVSKSSSKLFVLRNSSNIFVFCLNSLSSKLYVKSSIILPPLVDGLILGVELYLPVGELTHLSLLVVIRAPHVYLVLLGLRIYRHNDRDLLRVQ